MTPFSPSPFFRVCPVPHFISTFFLRNNTCETASYFYPNRHTVSEETYGKVFHSQKLSIKSRIGIFVAKKEVPYFLLKNIVRLSLSVRHVARLLLPVLHLGDPAAELDRPLRLPGRRHQAEMVRSQSDHDGLYQGDFKTWAKDGTYDFLYADDCAGSMYSCVQTRLAKQSFFQCSGSVTFWYGSGSAPQTIGSGSGSCSFYHRPSICQQKKFILITF
jgi:hypothetical protein